ncbi:MAG: hypothetical protein P4L46_19595, partial [Fimbriimonas sp.]|nr:hypothetical protein [Fimbriimonas sp.]
ALTALQNQVDGMKSYGEDIANLKKLADKFEKELTALGVDVEALKKDLGDISDRVKKLEARKPAVNIGGDVNLLMLAGNSNNNRPGLDMDGHKTGVTVAGAPTGMMTDLTVLEEGAFTFSGTNDNGPKWKGTIVIGNMLDTFGSQSTFQNGANGGYAQAKSDVYLQDFSVKFDSSVAGLAFNAEVGRVGYKISPYIFQRIDNTSYFSNDRWDDGLYRFDGGVLGFNFGTAKLDVFAGDTSKVTSVSGLEINPVRSGPLNGAFGGYPIMTFDRTLGANLNVPLETHGNLNVAYLILDSLNGIPVDGTGANRLAVYGGNIDFNFGQLTFGGGYSKSDLLENSTNVNNIDNSAWHVDGKYEAHRWGIGGGYREIDANYLAPGDWGQLGIERNPTNIKGFEVKGHLKVSDSLTLRAGGEWDTGKNSNYGGTTGFDTGTDISAWNVGLTWRMNDCLDLMVSYQDTEFTNLDGAVVTNTPGNTSASYKWTSFGIGYHLSDSAKFTIQYQISDISSDYQVVKGGGGRFTGGLLTTQFSVKF